MSWFSVNSCGKGSILLRYYKGIWKWYGTIRSGFFDSKLDGWIHLGDMLQELFFKNLLFDYNSAIIISLPNPRWFHCCCDGSVLKFLHIKNGYNDANR